MRGGSCWAPRSFSLEGFSLGGFTRWSRSHHAARGSSLSRSSRLHAADASPLRASRRPSRCAQPARRAFRDLTRRLAHPARRLTHVSPDVAPPETRSPGARAPSRASPRTGRTRRSSSSSTRSRDSRAADQPRARRERTGHRARRRRAMGRGAGADHGCEGYRLVVHPDSSITISMDERAGGGISSGGELQNRPVSGRAIDASTRTSRSPASR